MPFCPNCGSEVKSEGVFCQNCGVKIGTLQEHISQQPPVREDFDLEKHINTLRRDGLTRPQSFEITNEHRAYKKDKWDPKKYVADVFESLLNGGFSYFRYASIPQESEGKALVRKRIPILLDDEDLKEVAAIVNQWPDWGKNWGLLYFTGRRFILDVERSKFKSQDDDALPSLPMISYWIKPDFSDLFSILDISFFREVGSFKKRRFNRISFNVISKGRKVQCEYIIDGPNGKEIMNDEYAQSWSQDKTGSKKGFLKTITELISKSKETKVSDLIRHAHTCHHMTDVMIETNPLTGPQRVNERPFSYWGPYPILV